MSGGMRSAGNTTERGVRRPSRYRRATGGAVSYLAGGWLRPRRRRNRISKRSCWNCADYQVCRTATYVLIARGTSAQPTPRFSTTPWCWGSLTNRGRPTNGWRDPRPCCQVLTRSACFNRQDPGRGTYDRRRRSAGGSLMSEAGTNGPSENARHRERQTALAASSQATSRTGTKLLRYWRNVDGPADVPTAVRGG